MNPGPWTVTPAETLADGTVRKEIPMKDLIEWDPKAYLSILPGVFLRSLGFDTSREVFYIHDHLRKVVVLEQKPERPPVVIMSDPDLLFEEKRITMFWPVLIGIALGLVLMCLIWG